MTYRLPSSGRRTAGAFAIALALVPVIATGCGGDDKPAVCGDLEQLSSDMDSLKAIDVTPGEGAIADIDASLNAIMKDLSNVKASAESELSDEIAALETSLNAASAKFDDAKADGDFTGTEAQGLLDSLATLSTSWEALKAAAPDCDLDE